MIRRISAKFQELKSLGKKAFIPFIVAGDPDLETTIKLVLELEQAGSHVIELGVPFSDPVADGPTIQKASGRALKNNYGISDYLQAVREIRKGSEVPIMLFSYLNPVYQYGLEKLAGDAKSAGVDGALITDITPEESDSYRNFMEKNELDCIFLAAPTSGPERIAKIAAVSSGFVYVVSRAGVTGAQQEVSDTVLPTVERVRQCTSLPVAVGFGISKPEQVQAVWKIADGAVVGSAIVAEMEQIKDPKAIPSRIGGYCRWLTGA
jgi:tryptophan synthase alpha chain